MAGSTLARSLAHVHLFLPREEKAVQTISPPVSFFPSLAGGQVDVVADEASGLQRACNRRVFVPWGRIVIAFADILVK